MTGIGVTPGRRSLPRWPLILIAAPAAVAIWSGWVGLGQMSGFGIVHPLPGIWGSLRINTAITLPIGVEAYGAYALGAWLRPGSGERARMFARRSAFGALTLGVAGQVAYHLLSAGGAVRAPWPVVLMVACLPVVAFALAVSLAHLQSADEAMPSAVGEATPEATDEATGRATAEPPEMPSGEPSEMPPGEPEPGPRHEPRQRPPRLSKDPDAENARTAYRKSVRQGTPLTDRALGDMYNRSRTWGSNRIAEAEAGPKIAKAQ